MALPPQAIEKLMHNPSETQGAYKQFILLGTSLFILMVLLYAGIAFGYSAYLKSSSASLDKKIKDFAAKTPVEEQAQAANFYSQLVNLRELLKGHVKGTPALAVLERSTITDVYFAKMNMNTATNVIDLNGSAKTLEAVARQAAAFQSQEGVSKVNFSNAGQGQGGLWQFTMSVFLDESVLRGFSSVASSQDTTPPPSFPSSSSTTSTTP